MVTNPVYYIFTDQNFNQEESDFAESYFLESGSLLSEEWGTQIQPYNERKCFEKELAIGGDKGFQLKERFYEGKRTVILEYGRKTYATDSFCILVNPAARNLTDHSAVICPGMDFIRNTYN